MAEVVQNSLDARQVQADGTKKIAKLKIKTVMVKEHVFNKYFQDICDRFSVICVKSGRNYIQPPSLECLVIEEFGTTGLTGETQDSDKDGPNEKWNSFFVGEGDETKSGDQLGRRGQGKITMHNASQIQSLIAMTNQDDAKKQLVMGKFISPITYAFKGRNYERFSFFVTQLKTQRDTSSRFHF